MDPTQCFLLRYRSVIDSSDVTPERSARQLSEILRRVMQTARRGPPGDPGGRPQLTDRRKDT